MSLDLSGSKRNEAEADAGYRTLRVIWLAILVGVVTLFVVTRLTQPATGGPRFVFLVLFALGLSTLGASFLLKYLLLRQAAEKRRPEAARSAYILAFALCEATGLFGVLAHFVTGAEQYYFLFVLSGFGVLMHKPRREDLLAAYGAGIGQGSAQRHEDTKKI